MPTISAKEANYGKFKGINPKKTTWKSLTKMTLSIKTMKINNDLT
eukprot:CAMPEP_0116896396 /NCGR_PEP_ID=MMETSP0467-20121206/5644_1 /TAXON_ID=283647 /ORGANISM="Mesodinium pulex, Strain SPMC105" /LENGTH=44 /DNA_ID= /DNA_START= /DNA_END= /DNA_ORIENTATION=